MKPLLQAVRRKLWALVYFLGLFLGFGFSAVATEPAAPGFLDVTNLAMLRNAITRQAGSICAYDLEGTVLAADTNSGTIFLQDASGNAALEAKINGMALRPGERVRLRGTNYVVYTDIGISLGTSPLVDDDSAHSTVERTGEIYLKAGRHPIRVTWFNLTGKYFLQVAYSGPQIRKQTIPATALFQNAGGDLQSGLRYHGFEGQWENIPDFAALTPKAGGIIANFDDSVRTRDESVGLDFNGYLEIKQDGNYQFYLSSDDGSQLFLDEIPPMVTVVGTVPVSSARPIVVGQTWLGQNSLWAETEGTITFMSEERGHVNLELVSGGNQMRVKVLNAPNGAPWYLLNSRVRVRGICPDMKNNAGQKYAGLMVVANWGDVQVQKVTPEQWSNYKNTTISELQQQTPGEADGMACLHGHLSFDPVTQTLRFEDPTGSAPVDLLTRFPAGTNLDFDCLSRWTRNGNKVWLNEAVVRESCRDEETNVPQILTTAMQVQQLSREEAERDYPVSIRGVVTWVSHDYRSLIVQDSTRAVFVWVGSEFPAALPHVGDYSIIKGGTQPADFSPIVNLQKATVLWRGEMPPPVKPTRDQLLSGSLDAQYVEIQGLVIATQATSITLLTSYGILSLDVTPAPNGQWKSYLNSFIRIRGCLLANWDRATHRVIADQPIHLVGAAVSIDSPPPADLFEADPMRVADLLKFDVRFDPFRRVKIRGQVIHCGPDVDYLMDGTTGLRFRLVQPMPLNPGDDVEVAGLVELGGVSPLLRQAVARVTGHSDLPDPRELSLNLLTNNYDSTLVSVEGTLVDIQEQGRMQILEMQVGVKSFVTRLEAKPVPPGFWPVGSRLKLTGTFSALDADRLSERYINSFELLLNSPQDVQIIARPPWWTLGRLLALLACLVAGLTLAFLWIALLRHQVGRRTRQLEHEIGERERIEKMRAIDQERSRIARDLHDDLGSTLTEISMMATPRPGSKIGSNITAERLQAIAEKSRSMISALDGVVWVVNSKNDTLSSLIEYIASHAEEFLAKAGVACRVELPANYPEQIILSEVRHDVMLAVREVLNNSVRHGHPQEVLLRVIIAGNSLNIVIQDDGCGFDSNQIKGNGLVNLEHRMHKLKGFCQIHSSLKGGTKIVLQLPLPELRLNN